MVAGDLTAARAVTDRLEQLMLGAPADLGPEIRRFVLACRGFELLFSGATTDAVATLREASVMQAGPVAIPLGVPHDYVAAVDALLAVALALAGDDVGADEAVVRALQRTTHLPFPIGPFSEAVVRVYAAYVCRLRGDVDGARREAATVSAIGERHGFREHAMLGQILLLAASAMDGDLGSCQALETVLGLWRMAGGGLAVPVLLAELAEGLPARRRTQGGAHRARRCGDDDGADGPARLRARGASNRRDARLRRRLPSRRHPRSPAGGGGARAGSGFAAAERPRASRCRASVLGDHADPGVAEIATRLWAGLAGSATGELREIERWISAPTA